MNGNSITTALRVLGRTSLSTLALFGLALESEAAPNPPLQNSGFEIVGPLGPITVSSPPAPGGGGHSAADGWGVFHNTVPASGATTTTSLVPTTRPFSNGVRMIRVDVDQPLNGIVGVKGPFNSGSPQGIGSAWVYVVNGVVGMGTGNGGNTGFDAMTTTTGAWEHLQAPNGQSPFNEIIFYSVGGPAVFFVDDAGMDEVQEPNTTASIEYSNDRDEQAAPGGGDHGGTDPGQTMYTEIVDGVLDPYPLDGVDFYPGIESGEEPDAQIDALANGLDYGFGELLEDRLDLAFSIEGDGGPVEPVAVWAERISGVNEAAYTHRDLHALNIFGDIDDVDALEMWGRRPVNADESTQDANYFSLENDVADVSVWSRLTTGVPAPYISRGFIHSRLMGLGFQGSIEEVDVDALMVRDTNGVGVWDEGDEILFSIRESNNFDGGEIIHLKVGSVASFFRHGGHLWDTAFDIRSHFPVRSEELDAIEVPEPATFLGLACGGLALLGLNGVRRGRLTPRPLI